MGFVLYIVVYAMMSAAGLALIKSGFSNMWLVPWNSVSGVFQNGWIVLGNMKLTIGMTLYVAGFCMWIYLLSQKPLSYAFPIASGAIYVAITFNAYFFLGEEISPSRILGIVLIAVGAVLVGRTV